MRVDDIDPDLEVLAAHGHGRIADDLKQLAKRPDASRVDDIRARLCDAVCEAPVLREKPFEPKILIQGESNGAPENATPPTARPLPATHGKPVWKSLLFDAAASLENWLRNMEFERKLRDGYTGPVVVAEGDSWFCFPISGPTDVAEHLSFMHAVYNLARPGDLLADYLDEGQINRTFGAIDEYGADVLILSGGGNEIIGENFVNHLRYDGAYVDDLEYVSFDSVSNAIVDLKGYLQAIIEKVSNDFPTIKILAHSYDWPAPLDQSGWLSGPLHSVHIQQIHWNGIVRAIIDRYAAAMDELEGQYPGTFFHADLRGSGEQNPHNWYDEIHLTSFSAQTAAKRLHSRINSCVA